MRSINKNEKNKNNNINENNIEEKVKNKEKLYLIGRIQNFSNEFRKNEQQFLKYLKEMGGDQEYLSNNFNSNNLEVSFNSLEDEKEK